MDQTRSTDLVPTPTAHLTFLMDHYRRINRTEDFDAFCSYMRQKADEYLAKLSCLPPGAERAIAATRLLDEELAKAAHISHSCSRGCAHCCKFEVEITADEAERLANLIRNGHPIDRARLSKQASRERRSKEWQTASDDNRCVFLGADDGCTIYPMRPNTCRKVLVVTPPGECANPSGKPHPITIPLGELIISVALSLPDNGPVSLARGLAKRLEATSQDESPPFKMTGASAPSRRFDSFQTG